MTKKEKKENPTHLDLPLKNRKRGSEKKEKRKVTTKTICGYSMGGIFKKNIFQVGGLGENQIWHEAEEKGGGNRGIS